MIQAAALCGVLCSFAVPLGDKPADPIETSVEISDAERDADGFLVHRVRSPYQSGPTHVKVLLPDRLDDGGRYRVLYVLPVEAGDGYDNFRTHHVEMHEQLARLAVPHVYRDGPRRRHHWQSGWLREAVDLLVGPDPTP